jgi:uncharacterized protein YjiS (DUF1127 family)
MSSGMRSWVRALMLWWRAWRTRTRNHRPSEEFVDHTLADVALSRADVDLARAQVRRDMSRMMRHFEVDPDRIAPAYGSALRSAERFVRTASRSGAAGTGSTTSFPIRRPCSAQMPSCTKTVRAARSDARDCGGAGARPDGEPGGLRL